MTGSACQSPSGVKSEHKTRGLERRAGERTPISCLGCSKPQGQGVRLAFTMSVARSTSPIFDIATERLCKPKVCSDVLPRYQGPVGMRLLRRAHANLIGDVQNGSKSAVRRNLEASGLHVTRTCQRLCTCTNGNVHVSSHTGYSRQAPIFSALPRAGSGLGWRKGYTVRPITTLGGRSKNPDSSKSGTTRGARLLIG